MQTPNGQGVVMNKHSANTTNDARHALAVGSPLTASQAELLHLVECQGCQELSRSLKMVHDLALYHTDVPFDQAEKDALFDLKLLWEGFERMMKNA